MSPETRAEIRRLCGYITDDGYIASYMGVNRAMVASIRNSLPRFRPYGTQSTDHRVAHAGQSQEREWADMCQRGSKQLGAAIDAYLARRAA